MRRQMHRPTQFGRIRPAHYGQRAVVQNPTTATATSIGRPMAERPANINAEIAQKRRELQEKYKKEAEEAEEKKRRREQRKKEEWLKRQEALVRPGYRLGHGTKPSNLRRDIIDHQTAIDSEPHETSPNVHQQLADQQFTMLVQQGIERGRDAAILEKKIEEFGRQAQAEKMKGDKRNKKPTNYSDRRNPRKPVNISSSSSASSAHVYGNPRKPAYCLEYSLDVGQNTSSNSNANVRGSPRKPTYSLDVGQNASTNSNPNDSGNTFKPTDSLAVGQSASSTSNANVLILRKPANSSGVGQNAASNSNTNVPGNPEKPAYSLDVGQSSSSTFKADVHGNHQNPANILNVEQGASSASNANVPRNAQQPANFLGVAQAVAPTSSINVPRNPANFLGGQSASSTSSSNVPRTPQKPVNIFGVAQSASASSTNANLQEVSGYVLGSGDKNAGDAAAGAIRDAENDNRERMRAARLRMQLQYNEEVRRAEQTKDQEVNNVADGVGQISLK